MTEHTVGTREEWAAARAQPLAREKEARNCSSIIFERWESQTALETFRSSGPDTETAHVGDGVLLNGHRERTPSPPAALPQAFRS
jgi:hypothetical protein